MFFDVNVDSQLQRATCKLVADVLLIRPIFSDTPAENDLERNWFMVYIFFMLEGILFQAVIFKLAGADLHVEAAEHVAATLTLLRAWPQVATKIKLMLLPQSTYCSEGVANADPLWR